MTEADLEMVDQAANLREVALDMNGIDEYQQMLVVAQLTQKCPELCHATIVNATRRSDCKTPNGNGFSAMSLNEHQLLDAIVQLAKTAGEAILDIYNCAIQVSLKADQSPLTEADLVSHQIIAKGLQDLTPHIPIISEEGDKRQEGHSSFWLVDPLDGTKEFIEHNGEFTVNIALIENNLPKLGVVYAPALQLLFAGIVGEGGYRIDDQGRQIPLQVKPYVDQIFVVGSRRHGNSESMDRLLAQLPKHKMITIGSSLKFCKIADGSAHLYPRFGRTMEWDTAAGQAVVMAAGGCVRGLDGQMLIYGKPGFENPHFVACAEPDFSYLKTCHA